MITIMESSNTNILKTILYLLLFPVTGIVTTIKDFKRREFVGKDFGDFMEEWGLYLLLLPFWCAAIGIICTIIYHLIVNTAITCCIIFTVIVIAFFIIGLPYLIYKNIKWEK